MNIGLTGGIASGKSTVSAMLADRGAKIIDADRIAREIVEPDHPVLAQIVETFGQAVLRQDGTLDRGKLGEIVFHDPDQRKRLESIMHPAIRKLMLERMKKAEQEQPERLVVVDVPLLYESGIDHMFQRVMVVYVPRDVQLQRLIERNGFTRDEADARIRAQMDIERKKEKADIVIDNSGELSQTEAQIEIFLDTLPHHEER